MSFDPQVFDEGLFGSQSMEGCLFDGAIFDSALFDTCEEVSPDAPVVAPAGGWAKHPWLRRVEEEEKLEIAPEATTKPVETAPVLVKAWKPQSVPDFSEVKDEAYRAYLKEFSYLMAQEAIRKAKRKRDAEMLLLLM